MTRDEITARARKVVEDHYRSNGQDVPAAIGDDFPLIGGGSHLGDAAEGDLDSLDHVEITMSLEEVFEIEIPDDAAEQMKTFGAVVKYLVGRLGDAAADEEDDLDPPEKCFLCDEPFKDGDMVLDDMSGETGHVGCFGPDRESYVKDLDTGEPLGPDDPIPTGYAWKDPARAVVA